MSLTARRRAPVRLILTLALTQLAALAAAEPFLLSRGILVDDRQDQVYFTDPDGHLRAVHLADGRAAWASAERGLPLAVAGDQLVALGTVQQFGLGMALLIDPASGTARDRVAFDLPEGVSAEVSPKPMREFDAVAASSAGGVRIFWHFQSQPLRGAHLPEDDAAPVETPRRGLRLELDGAVDLTLGAGAAYAQTVRGTVLRPLSPQPDLTAAERLPNLPERQFRSADDAHVLVSQAIDDPVVGSRNRWQLFARGSVTALGELDSHYALAPFVVRGSVLLYRAAPIAVAQANGHLQETGPQLIAYDLSGKRQLWAVPVQDLQYHGPLPP